MLVCNIEYCCNYNAFYPKPGVFSFINQRMHKESAAYLMETLPFGLNVLHYKLELFSSLGLFNNLS